MILSALLRTHVNPASSPTMKNSQLQRLACSYLILNAIRALRNPFQMTMLATLSLLLVIIPLSLSEPICQNPAPPASYIPNLVDCQDLVKAIFAASVLQGDEPILWSRSPSAFARSRKLPYSFKSPFASSDCEFIIDELHGGSQDTFPTKLVAEKAEEIVEKCMERGIDGTETVGAVTVGPKCVIAIVLMRKERMGGGVGAEVLELNMTNVTMVGPGNFSAGSPPFVEED